MSLHEYREFIASRAAVVANDAVIGASISDKLKSHQRADKTSSIVFSSFRCKLAEISREMSGCHGSLNTQIGAGKNTRMTPKNARDENHKAETQRKTGNTCGNTMPQIQKNLQTLRSGSKGTTPREGRDTQKIKNMQTDASRAQDCEALHLEGMPGLRLHTGLTNLTSIECSRIRDTLVQYAGRSTKIKEERSCTSITATKQGSSGSCFAAHATPLSEKCETIQIDCEGQSSIWSAIDEKHVCPLQLDVIDNCLRLYSKPGDVVMDPFNGIGSTGYQAVKMLRRYLGFELKPEYAEVAGRNMAEAERHCADLFAA